jgi:pimeloyl-ACP methyl ester carboxylesterase
VILVGRSVGGLKSPRRKRCSIDRVRTRADRDRAQAEMPRSARGDAARLDHGFGRLIHEAYLSFGRDSAQGERLYGEIARMDPLMVKSWIRLALYADLAGQMRKLLPPMLAVLAPNSWDAKESWPQVARTLGYEGVPRVEPVRIENAGHFLMLDQPQALAEYIAKFVIGSAQNNVVSTLER